MQTLLDLAQRSESQGALAATSATSSDAIESVVGDNVSNELKLASSMILSSPSIAINSSERYGLVAFEASGEIINQQRKRKLINFSGGTLTVSTNKRFRHHTRQQHGSHPAEHQSRRRAFIAKILFKPKTSQSMLTLSISQFQTLQGSVLSIPRLSINNVLQKGSVVFEVARSGRVEDLTRLVADGKACLRDHDTDGWSLLHNRLDVDEIATARFTELSSVEISPLHLLIDSKSNESVEILLDAGADPTLDLKGWISFLHCLSGRMEVQSSERVIIGKEDMIACMVGKILKCSGRAESIGAPTGKTRSAIRHSSAFVKSVRTWADDDSVEYEDDDEDDEEEDNYDDDMNDDMNDDVNDKVDVEEGDWDDRESYEDDNYEQGGSENEVDNNDIDENTDDDEMQVTARHIRNLDSPGSRSFAVWESTYQPGMDWDSTHVDPTDSQEHFQYDVADSEYDELFYMPWGHNQELHDRSQPELSPG
ncbi:hypothetical protein BDV96DRAFT_600930 [Lophiotrema nucula]|uniref:Peptidase A2 domain-containing protein n=1 Tax=Lophiotrema nucula TaxID=690887 RepID=A0A6A5Z769_9PLEO|nr:hypothetical protein BDV96DRAFT_600930 [Lophiotrema nucula]